MASNVYIACSKRSDSGERCEVKIAMKRRGGLGREVSPPPLPRFYFFALLFSLHRSPLSERLEQAKGVQSRSRRRSVETNYATDKRRERLLETLKAMQE